MPWQEEDESLLQEASTLTASLQIGLDKWETMRLLGKPAHRGREFHWEALHTHAMPHQCRVCHSLACHTRFLVQADLTTKRERCCKSMRARGV